MLKEARQSMEKKRPTMPSSGQIGWHVAKGVGTAHRIHRTIEGTPSHIGTLIPYRALGDLPSRIQLFFFLCFGCQLLAGLE